MVTLIIVECCVAILILFVVIAIVASIKRRKAASVKVQVKEKEEVLHDPYGLYAPISCIELAAIDAQASGKHPIAPAPEAPCAPVPCAPVVPGAPVPCAPVVPGAPVPCAPAPVPCSQTLSCEICGLCATVQADVK